MTVAAVSVEEVQAAVRSLPAGARLLPVAGASKPGLSRCGGEDVVSLDVSGLSGVLEYDPAELTVTARAGTPIRELAATLAEHGQYLPFDPPLVAAGATLGGAVAAGVSGPCALRYGGVRDFVIGVKFVDGNGRLISGGGKVVKNAAGFDWPKLMVGSIGRLGVMVALSFKVFPCAAATATLECRFDSVSAAVDGALALAHGPVELEALDITGDGTVLARVGGGADTQAARIERLAAVGSMADVVCHTGEPERALWRAATEFSWAPPAGTLVHVGLSIRRLGELDAALARVPRVQARYSLAGTAASVSWPADNSLDELDGLLSGLDLAGMMLRGPSDADAIGAVPGRALLGLRSGGAFGRRVAQALNPDGRYLEV